jgi:predicted Zn-ribbon and HTH transcriptional regulator
MEAMEQGKRLEKKKQSSLLSKIKGLEEEEKGSTKIKGFLQQNPVLCSGCGTPFQSKSPDNPGRCCELAHKQ